MYHDLLAAVANRINAITGALAPAMETAYNVRPLTTTQFQSTVFPFSAVKQALLNAEEKLAHAIANTSGHPWRASLAGVTSGLAHGAAIPVQSSLSRDIIGELGTVYDSSDSVVCTEKPLPVIRRRVRNANSFYRTPVYYFKVDGARIYHTRTGVVIDVCVYDRTVQVAAITADGGMLLPEVLEEAYIAGAVSFLVRDDEYMGQSALYRGYFNDTLQMIHQGFTAVPAKVAA